jgi:hypothetical protein
MIFVGNAMINSSISDGECHFLLLNRQLIEKSDSSKKLLILASIVEQIEVPLYEWGAGILDKSALLIIMSALRKQSANNNRLRLLVAGAYLEDEITVCALEALMEGYDVYLLNEIIISRSNQFHQVFSDRLMQAGVIPSTLRQLLYHWMTATVEPSRSEKLQKLINEYETQ